MIRLLSVIAAIAALAVSAAPAASASPSKKPPPRGTAAAHYLMINASGGWDPTLRAAQARVGALYWVRCAQAHAYPNSPTATVKPTMVRTMGQPA